ncbi:MAG: aspartyl protease family protein [Candidatus Magasanikbacteria bacterium]|nr:aspartyl protease family protein [Candidatus Magasanikbacteria bacterium]
MKFKYKKFGSGILRPVIPIGLIYQNRFVRYEVLVDSGADFCIFDAQIGELLGIDIRNGERKEVGGITGSVEYFYVHPVTIQVGGWPFEIEAGFLPNIAELGHGVVGQRGFFDIFVVRFDFLKEEIELRKRI